MSEKRLLFEIRGLMKSTQPANSSSQAPSLVQLNSNLQNNHLLHHHPQFQPIQQQPLVHSSNISKVVFDAGRVNATATHIELEQQSTNCNITTLLNMSCRGRAEAFARSLQSRLRTLGSQDNDTDEVAEDAVDGSQWINNSNNNTGINAVTDIQPRINSQHNVEPSDSYFDFDMEEPESPGSPIDECEYTRLIETTGSTPQESQAPESGFVCASPCSTLENESRGSASSSDAQFFDPESSDTGTEFYDCPTIEAPLPHRPHRRVYHHLSHNKIAIRPPSPIAQSPSSSSSSATPTSKMMNGHVRLLESNDSSESLPPSQSTSSNLNCDGESNSMSTANSNSNSTLQDADVEMPAEVNIDEIASMNDVKFDENAENDKCTFHNFDSSRTLFIKYNEADDEYEDKSPEKESVSLPSQDGENIVNEKPVEEKEKLTDGEFDQNKVLDEITMKKEEEQFEMTDVNQQQIIVEDYDKELSTETNDEQKKTRKDSDADSDYERPPRVRRCSSLKTGKTPPGTPGRKKIVRFADVLGLDLADVRTFLDEVPKVPKSAYEDLDVTLPTHQSVQLRPPLDKVLVPLFQQPGCLPNFLERLRDAQVCLESAAVTDPINLTITGCVRVRNLDFHKSVHIRYTLDGWRTYSDLSASYVENSCDGFSDKFSFIFFGNSLQVGGRVEMAIRFQVKGEQYWDSNYGMNYCFQCLPCNTGRISPIMASDSSLSSSSEATSSYPSETIDSTSSNSTSSHVDTLGHRQWSNSFLY
ncbi:hypothetical protein PVAND_000634 [Polypedilum vanderplanki]|uniref:CBM21 domain-containing protein n=1 Tax=Polypedilum vanderplanki TaxID=319348 RepID=A0A9J6BLK8_POLVA|nr:hypothetical protein PVAND_000634 [Polypedilum vanderplanki]